MLAAAVAVAHFVVTNTATAAAFVADPTTKGTTSFFVIANSTVRHQTHLLQM